MSITWAMIMRRPKVCVVLGGVKLTPELASVLSLSQNTRKV